MESALELTEKLRSELPAEAFRPQAWRAWLAVPLVTFIAFGLFVLLTDRLAWYWALPLSLAVGNAFGSLGFLGHETLHGSVTKNRTIQNLIGYFAFAPFCFTPTLWRVWHNQVHHVHTNEPDIDPDSYGTLTRFQKVPLAKFQFKTGVGSGSAVTLLFFFYRFTYHAQIVLWVISKKYADLFRALPRKRAIAESMALFAFWIGLAIWAGPKGALFGVVIPLAVANAILMSYIATNHFLRPLAQIDEPVDNSMSVTVPKWVDWMHLNFSHHVEHHYFPTMSPRYVPLVRQALLKYVPDRYLAPPHWRAVLWLYKTPRVYKDATTLVDPYRHREVPIPEVEHVLHDLTPHPAH
jgi:fatty acid desaturase